MNTIKLLIVDDSAIIRQILTTELSKYPEIEIVGTAPDPYIARDKIIQLKPDVMTLDIEMPRMDGITFLEKLMKSHPMPVIILSTLTPHGCELALRAFDLGAIEVIHKPELDVSTKLNEMIGQLVDKIKAAALTKGKLNIRPSISSIGVPKPLSAPFLKTTDKVVAIGASTGGTEAIRAILPMLPAHFPGIVIAQHMPANFTRSFADSLDKVCALQVKEAEENDTIRPGLVLLAPGNYHMVVRRSGARYYVTLNQGPMVHHQRPAVDVLFMSVAKYVGANALGVILTGMGKDGADGLLKMKEAGAPTIGQDERSSVVYGMPKVAAELGAVQHVRSLESIPGTIIQLLSKM
jgi:two-component system chemotaxis response regulator CheB